MGILNQTENLFQIGRVHNNAVNDFKKVFGPIRDKLDDIYKSIGDLAQSPIFSRNRDTSNLDNSLENLGDRINNLDDSVNSNRHDTNRNSLSVNNLRDSIVRMSGVFSSNSSNVNGLASSINNNTRNLRDNVRVSNQNNRLLEDDIRHTRENTRMMNDTNRQLERNRIEEIQQNLETRRDRQIREPRPQIDRTARIEQLLEEGAQRDIDAQGREVLRTGRRGRPMQTGNQAPQGGDGGSGGSDGGSGGFSAGSAILSSGKGLLGGLGKLAILSELKDIFFKSGEAEEKLSAPNRDIMLRTGRTLTESMDVIGDMAKQNQQNAQNWKEINIPGAGYKIAVADLKAGFNKALDLGLRGQSVERAAEVYAIASKLMPDIDLNNEFMKDLTYTLSRSSNVNLMGDSMKQVSAIVKKASVEFGVDSGTLMENMSKQADVIKITSKTDKDIIKTSYKLNKSLTALENAGIDTARSLDLYSKGMTSLSNTSAEDNMRNLKMLNAYYKETGEYIDLLEFKSLSLRDSSKAQLVELTGLSSMLKDVATQFGGYANGQYTFLDEGMGATLDKIQNYFSVLGVSGEELLQIAGATQKTLDDKGNVLASDLDVANQTLKDFDIAIKSLADSPQASLDYINQFMKDSVAVPLAEQLKLAAENTLFASDILRKLSTQLEDNMGMDLGGVLGAGVSLYVGAKVLSGVTSGIKNFFGRGGSDGEGAGGTPPRRNIFRRTMDRIRGRTPTPATSSADDIARNVRRGTSGAGAVDDVTRAGARGNLLTRAGSKLKGKGGKTALIAGGLLAGGWAVNKLFGGEEVQAQESPQLMSADTQAYEKFMQEYQMKSALREDISSMKYADIMDNSFDSNESVVKSILTLDTTIQDLIDVLLKGSSLGGMVGGTSLATAGALGRGGISTTGLVAGGLATGGLAYGGTKLYGKFKGRTPSAVTSATDDIARGVSRGAVSSADDVARGSGKFMSKAGKFIKKGAKGIPVLGTLVGLGFSAYDIANADDKTRAVWANIGSWVGGAGAGAAAGAGLGALGGSIAGPVGTFVGGGIGTVVGGIAGAIGGEAAVTAIYDNMDSIKEKAGEIWTNTKVGFNATVDLLGDGLSKVKDFAVDSYKVVGDVASKTWEGTKDVASSVAKGVSNLASSTWEGTKNLTSSVGKGISSAWKGATSWLGFATGLSNVPVDGFPAVLHKGEMVLPPKQANWLRVAMGYSPVPTSNVSGPKGSHNKLVQSLPQYATGIDNVGGSRLSGDTDTHQGLLARLNSLANAYDKDIVITSGFRSEQEQKNSIDNALRKSGYYGSYSSGAFNSKGNMMVAPVGGSRHNYGFAADVSGWVNNLGNSKLSPFGLYKPMSYESWHIEPKETKGKKSRELKGTVLDGLPYINRGALGYRGDLQDDTLPADESKALLGSYSKDVKSMIDSWLKGSSEMTLEEVSLSIRESAKATLGKVRDGVSPIGESIGRPLVDIGKSVFKSGNDFIDKISQGAIKGYLQGGVLPSLTIAQAILESNWGKQSIGNNIFGIKAGKGWEGLKQKVWTNEEYNGVMHRVQDWFRDYATIDDSILDHTKILQNSRYAKVRTAQDYKQAALAVYQGGYATDSQYPNKLIRIIEDNQLYKFDAFRQGGIIDSPTMSLMGEDSPRYKEYVIPTNPAYKGRAVELLSQASEDVGVTASGMLGGGLTVNVDSDNDEVVLNLKTIASKLDELVSVMKGSGKSRGTGRTEAKVSATAMNIKNYI